MIPFSISHPGWLAAGLLIALLGVWMIRWANRNNMTAAIRDATVGVAIDAVAKRGRPNLPVHARTELDKFKSASVTGKARTVASYGIRQSLSQLLGVTGFILVMSGLVMAVFGLFYA